MCRVRVVLAVGEGVGSFGFQLSLFESVLLGMLGSPEGGGGKPVVTALLFESRERSNMSRYVPCMMAAPMMPKKRRCLRTGFLRNMMRTKGKAGA